MCLHDFIGDNALPNNLPSDNHTPSVFQLAPPDPGVKREKPGGPSAESASFERCRREDRGAEGAEGSRVWGGGVPLPTGGGVWVGGCAPYPENFSIFELKKTTFGAFCSWMETG